MSEPKRPTLDDVLVLETWHDIIEDEADCSICGETFQVGEKAVTVPFDSSGTLCSSRFVVTVHLHCAVKQDEVELTGSIPS